MRAALSTGERLSRAAGSAMDARAAGERAVAAGSSGGRGRVLLNFVLFQAGWFVCVLGAARDSTAAALGWAALTAGVCCLTAARPSRALLMLAACAGLGLAVDGLLIGAGHIRFPLDPPALLGVPLWIGGIWVLFATTFDGCLAWLGQRPWLALACGAVGSPLSFASAQAFGALEVAPGWGTTLAVGAAWGLLMPAELWLARRILGSPAR